MPPCSCMCLIDAGLLIAYAILITHALAGVANILPLSESHPVEGLWPGKTPSWMARASCQSHAGEHLSQRD